MSDNSITLKHGGPLHFFEVDLSGGPGVLELRGSKGVGKTSFIKAIDHLAGRKVDLTVTDGELSGEVRGFGVVAPIGGRRRRQGSLEVDVIDADKFTVEDLISPPIKTPAAADKHRIKALVTLRGVEANPADYYELVGGRESLEELVPPDKLDTDDPVVLANRIKDALETGARSLEGQSAHELGHAQSAAEEIEGVDFDAEHDRETLSQRQTAAIQKLSELESQLEASRAEKADRDAAEAALKKAIDGYDGPTVEDADLACDKIQNKADEIHGKIVEMQRELTAAKAELSEAKLKRASAKQHEQTCHAWRETLSRELTVEPTEDELAAARQEKQSAQECAEEGVRIRDAIKARDRERKHRKDAERLATRANDLRGKAQSTLDVLTSLIDCPQIRAESVDGHTRLVVDHHTRGKKTLFAELSDGERVRHCIDATMPQLAGDGPSVFTVPQRIWQDLPPKDRAELDEYAKENNIYIIGAQVTDGPLQVVRWTPLNN